MTIRAIPADLQVFTLFGIGPSPPYRGRRTLFITWCPRFTINLTHTHTVKSFRLFPQNNRNIPSSKKGPIN